ncbi:MAG: hypothetical protein HY277_02355, partial [Ignavibacteriales bacterium]|nr:hypothetical protein [Ignavibacteriales bacterium]
MKSILVQAILALTVFAFAFEMSEYRTDSTLPSESSIQKERLEATYAMQAMRWYNDQRSYPTGTIPYDWRERALSHTKQHNLQKTSAAASISWSSVGPDSIAGRTRSIAIDPSNSNIIYCGSVSGGIWKSTDGGTSWSPKGDFASSLVIGCIAIDPSNTSIIYAGTGEGYFNVDALRGVGVLKSTDSGTSWSLQNNFIGASSPYYYYYINKLVIRPDNTNTLFAAVSATNAGIWKSTDAGASWNKITTVGSSSNFCVDLVMDPTNADIMYAAFGLFSTDGIYKTTNGGSTWNKLTNGFPATSTKYNRISLAIAKSNPSVLYACLSDSNYYTHSIQKSTDAGASWLQVGTPMDLFLSSSHLGGQGWYNNVIAVHPTNPSIVYTGGNNTFKSIDGGSNWTQMTHGYPPSALPYIHVDQHAIAINQSSPSIIYFGNDGGMFKTTDGGVTFSQINNGLMTAQFYSGAVHPTAEIYFGGTQDNGTLRTTASPKWTQVFGGDGGYTAVDFTSPSNVYTEYVYLNFQKSTSSGAAGTWSRMMSGIPTSGGAQSDGTSDRCSFIAPFVMDPSNSQVIVAGTFKAYRTTNGGSSWSAIGSDLTGAGDGSGQVGSPGATITAIAIAKTPASSTIYVGTSGSSSPAAHSKIQVSTNTGGVWNDRTSDPPLPNRVVRAIAVDPTNGARAFAGYSGYNANTPTTPGHVFQTTNSGTTWSNASGDLPDIPVNTIIIDPNNTNHLVVGTDLGIYESWNSGTNWFQQNNGLANVSVADLDLRGDRYLFAATHGRGMFKSSAPLVDAVYEEPSTNPLSFALHQNY